MGVHVFTIGPLSTSPTGVFAYTLAYYAAVDGRLRLHRPAASSAADRCLRLHSWPIMPLLMGVYIFTNRLAFAAADWCLRLHGWPIMPPLLGVYDFTAGLPPSPPSGASAYTAGLLCRRCWASTTSPPACLRRRRVVPPPTQLAYYAAAVGRLRLHRRPASVAAEWCLRLHGWPIMPPLLDVYILTVGSPSLPSTGMDQSEHHRPARLRRRRLVSSPARLAFMPPLLGVYVFTDRLAFAAADWCFRLHSWPIMPPLLGAYVFTDRLAFVAADWCPRLHGWPIMPPLLGVYVFTDRLAFAAADWCFRLHGWPLCRRCWASTSSPTGRLVCRRLVFPPARLAFMPPLLGVYVFTDWLAFAAADWCFRLHG
ncbi:HGWP repeat containing protein-like [Oryza sativa Japonica Group]|uniref:cysteine dioxygenase n=1 Tax=Oryza sativa subsp. japonica TaxID=39947 RepID=Q5JLE6_ORYSJ|nr:HGWP repeat containing protein-like [Oryza sativa Japonica Group]